MNLAYPDRSGVLPGDDLVRHVSTDATSFRVDIVRQEATEVTAWSSDWLAGQIAAVPADPTVNLHWPVPAGCRVPVPPYWSTGVHLARLVEGDGNGGINATPAPPSAPPDPQIADPPDRFGAMFVVRPQAEAAKTPVLYKVPLFTFPAYNTTANEGLYDGGIAVTVNRPDGGYRGYYRHNDSPDAYDPASSRQTVEHSDYSHSARSAGRGWDAVHV
jgi:hypothetical protein